MFATEIITSDVVFAGDCVIPVMFAGHSEAVANGYLVADGLRKNRPTTPEYLTLADALVETLPCTQYEQEQP